MLTVLSVPKPFRGHIGIIQRNAIRSWVGLADGVQVMLMGSEEGTSEVAAEEGLLHFPNIVCNRFGTPLLRSVFHIADKPSMHDFFTRS